MRREARSLCSQSTGPTMPVNDSKSSGLSSILLGMAALVLAGAVGTIGLLQQVGQLGPKVGDIVAFDPAESISRDMKARIAATSTGNRPGAGCVLDVKAMHESGGSLVIESRLPQAERGFRVHWAGRRSSDDSTDCGASADLMLDQDDIEVLALAAGGFGVSATKQAHAMPWRSSAAVQ